MLAKMFTAAVIVAGCLSAVCQSGNGPEQNAAAHASCGAVANTGNNNKITIVCDNMSAEQAQKMVDLFNRILTMADSVDAALAKVNQALRNANPNNARETYNCEGTHHEVDNSPQLGGGSFSEGGENPVFQQMIDLLNAHDYTRALKVCNSEMAEKPNWLTPELVCAIALGATGDRAGAVRLTKDFDSRTGDAYSVGLCGVMANILHSHLQTDLSQ